jgi:hypothetical protein
MTPEPSSYSTRDLSSRTWGDFEKLFRKKSKWGGCWCMIFHRLGPLPKSEKVEPVRLSKNFDSIKRAYIFCTGGGDPVDEILQGKWGKLDGPYKVIESGHWPMIAKPEELVEGMLSLSTK